MTSVKSQAEGTAVSKDVYKYPLVLIKFYDHWSSNGWIDLDDMNKDMPILTSVGFLVHEDKHQYILCASMDFTDADKPSTQRKGILKGAIIEKRTLK